MSIHQAKALGDYCSQLSQICIPVNLYRHKEQTFLSNDFRDEQIIHTDYEPVFKLSIRGLSISERIAMIQFCMQPFASFIGCKPITHKAEIVDEQQSWNIYIVPQQIQVAEQLWIYANKNKLGLEFNWDNDQQEKNLLTLCGAVIQLNQRLELIKLLHKTLTTKLESWFYSSQEECRKYGLIIQVIRKQYYLAYTKHFDNEDWEGVIQVQMSRSSQKSIRKLQELIRRTPFEASIQFGDTIDVFLNFSFKGIAQASQIISLLIDASIIKQYSNLTIIPKKNISDMKMFQVDNISLIQSVRFFCLSYRKNSQKHKKQEDSDISQLFPETAKQSSFKALRQKLSFANYDQLDKAGLQFITEEYSQSHILFLTQLWQAGLRKWIQEIYKNWGQYHIIYWEAIARFMRLIDYKSFQIKEKYDSFYPNSTILVDYFMRRLNMKRIEVVIRERIQQKAKQLNRQLIRPEQDKIKVQVLREMQSYLKAPDYLVDSIVKYLIVVQDPQRKNQKFKLSISTELLKNKTINFPNLISVMQQFKAETSKWQDALSVVYKDVFKMTSINKSLENLRQSNEDKAQALKEKQKIVAQEKYFENVEEQNLTRVDCLGCSRNFIYNMNIYDNSANKTKIIVFQKIDTLLQRGNTTILKEMKMAICSLLNDIQGGVILFNCEKKYQNIMTLGTVITQKMKQDLKRIIDQILQSFYPQVGSQNVVVNFVPVIANPYTVKPFEGKELPYGGQLGLIKTKKYIRRKFYEGTYVMRIIVKPIDQSRVFYFLHDGQQILSVRQDQKIKQLKPKSLHKIIKQKMRFYIPKQYSYMSKNLLMMPTPLDHTCQTPQEGICVNVRYDLINVDGANYRQKTFRFVSLLRINRRLVQTVQLILIDLNIRSLIEPKFSQYQFALDETAILYHDVPNETIERLTSSHQSFAPLKDQIKIYRATEYLKVVHHYSPRSIMRQTLQKCSNMFRSQFQLSEMHLYQMNRECQSTFYVAGQSKIENIFLFLMLNYYNEPVEFDPIITQEFIEDHKDNWKQIIYLAMSTRFSVKEIYEHLQINLKPQTKVVYEFFKNSIQSIQQPHENMYDFPEIFSAQFNALLQFQDLTQWKENMLKWFNYDPEILIDLIQYFFNSQECLKIIGFKMLKLWLELKLEKQGLFTENLRQLLSDNKVQIDVKIQQVSKKINKLSDEGRITLQLKTAIEDKFIIFRNVGQEQYSLGAGDSFQNLDTSHKLILQSTSKQIPQSQLQLANFLELFIKYFQERQVNQISKFCVMCQPLINFVVQRLSQKKFKLVNLKKQFENKMFNFITFMQNQIESIVYQKMKQSIWIFRLLKKMRFLQRVRHFSKDISQAYTKINKAIQSAYKKAMDEFLAEKCPSYIQNIQNLCIMIQQIRFVTQDHIFDPLMKYKRQEHFIPLFAQKYLPYFDDLIESYKQNGDKYYRQNIQLFGQIFLNFQYYTFPTFQGISGSSIIVYQCEKLLKKKLKPIQYSQYYEKRPYFVYKNKNVSIKGYKFIEENVIYLSRVNKQSQQKIYKKLKRKDATQLQIIINIKMINSMLIDVLASLKSKLDSERSKTEQLIQALQYETNQEINEILQELIIDQLSRIDNVSKVSSSLSQSNLRISKVQKQSIIYLLKLYMKQFVVLLVYEQMCISQYAQTNKSRFKILYDCLRQLKKYKIFNQIMSEQVFKTFAQEKYQYLALKINHKQIIINRKDFVQALKEILSVAKQNSQYFQPTFGLSRFPYHFNQIDLNQPKTFDQEFEQNILKIQEYLDSLTLYNQYSNSFQYKNQCLRLLIYLIQIQKKPSFSFSSLQIMPIFTTMKELKSKLIRLLNDVINSCSNYQEWYYWSGQQFITNWMRNYCFAKIIYSLQILKEESILIEMPQTIKDLKGFIQKMGQRILNQDQQFLSWNIIGGQKSIFKTINKVVHKPQFTFLHSARKTCRRLAKQINNQKKEGQEPQKEAHSQNLQYGFNYYLRQMRLSFSPYFNWNKPKEQSLFFLFNELIEYQWNHFEQAANQIGISPQKQALNYMKKVLSTHSNQDTELILRLIKLIQNKRQRDISLEDRIELLSFLVLLFNKQYKRKYRKQVKDSIQLRLIQLIINPEADDLFLQDILTNGQLLQYIGVKSLYLSIMKKKQINIISSPYFFYQIKSYLHNLIHLLELQGKVLIFDYDEGLKYALQHYNSLIYQNLKDIYKFYSQYDLQVIKQGLKQVSLNQSLTGNRFIITNDTKNLIRILERQIDRNPRIYFNDINIEIIMKFVYSKGNKPSFQQLIKCQPVKGFLKNHPLLYTLLVQEVYKMTLDLKNASPYYSINRGRVSYYDSNGKIKQSLKYGYKAAFATLNQSQRMTQISKKQEMKMRLIVNGEALKFLSLSKIYKKSLNLISPDIILTAAHNMYCRQKEQQRLIQFNWFKQKSKVSYAQNHYYGLMKLMRERKYKAIYVISQQLMKKKLLIKNEGPDQTSTIQFISQAEELNDYMEKIRWLFIKNKTVLVTTPRMFKDVIKQLSQFDERWVRSCSLFCLYNDAVYDTAFLRKCELLVKEINIIHLNHQQKMNALINVLKMQYKFQDLQEIRSQSVKINSQLTQRQFIKNIVMWNKPPGGFKPPWKILLFVNGCQPSLVMIDWKKMLQNMFTSFSDNHQLLAKIVVYRHPKDDHQLSMVQTPYENSVETLSMFMEDFLPSSTYEQSNLSQLLSKKPSEDKLKIQFQGLKSLDHVFFIEDPKGFSKIARDFYEIRDKFSAVKLCEKLSVQSDYSGLQLKHIMRKNQDQLTESIISKMNQFELRRQPKNNVQVSRGFGAQEA